MDDDRQLLAAAGRGDRTALERIYHAHKSEMLTSAFWVLGRDRAAAEDVLHDVFVSLAQRARETELTTSLRSYLITSAVNRAKDVLRRRSNVAATVHIAETPAEGPLDPAEIAELSEESARLMQAVLSLPAEQREVVTLRVQGQLKFREIADATGASIDTVKSRYRYAIDALKKQLTKNRLVREDA